MIDFNFTKEMSNQIWKFKKTIDLMNYVEKKLRLKKGIDNDWNKSSKVPNVILFFKVHIIFLV